jgi:hypothetical protein
MLSDRDLDGFDEFDRDRLREALTAGGIPPTDETVKALDRGLSGIRVRYRLDRILRQRASPKMLMSRLEALRKAAAVAAEILDSEIGELCEISFWLDRAEEIRRQRHLEHVAKQLHYMVCQAPVPQARKRATGGAGKFDMARRPEEPETRLYLELHCLYRKLRGVLGLRIAGPYYRFAVHCVRLLDPDIRLPELDPFARRVRAAIKRHAAKKGKNQRRPEG